MDATPRHVIAFYIADRRGQSAPALWKKMPTAYQKHAVFYTAHYTVYTGVFPLLNTVQSPSSPIGPLTSNGQLYAPASPLAAGQSHAVVRQKLSH